MDKDLLDAKTFRNRNCMLTSCTSEGSQSMLRGIVSFSFCQRPNWPSHCLIGYFNESISDFIWTHLLLFVISSDLSVYVFGQFLEELLAGCHI